LDFFFEFEGQSIQPHLFLKLRIYANKRHSHTPAIIDVPLTGIPSIRHPEEQSFDVPIYEISDGFMMLHISLEFPKHSSMKVVLKYFLIIRGSRI
jgi:hypothetical protein